MFALVPPQVIVPRVPVVTPTVRVIAVVLLCGSMDFRFRPVADKILRVQKPYVAFIALVRPLGRVGVDLLVTAAMISTKEEEGRATLLTWLHTGD